MHLPFLCSTEAARVTNPEAGGQAAINSQREALFRHKRGKGDGFTFAWDPCGEGFCLSRGSVRVSAVACRVRGENQAECKYLTPSEKCQ